MLIFWTFMAGFSMGGLIVNIYYGGVLSKMLKMLKEDNEKQ